MIFSKKWRMGPNIEELAKKLYSKNLPYHNFDHALRSAKIGASVAEMKRANEGARIDENVIYYALLFHDAGYHENHTEKGFPGKEEYSAFLAEEALSKAGVDKDVIERVRKAIMSTKRENNFFTDEEKITRVADLADLAGDYEIFLKNNLNLKKESEFLSGKIISWAEWKKVTEKIIKFYLSQDIFLYGAKKGERGGSAFRNKAESNLKRFLAEKTEPEKEKAPRFGCSCNIFNWLANFLANRKIRRSTR